MRQRRTTRAADALRIDQITPTFERYDAIANEACIVRDLVLGAGHAASIYSPLLEPGIAGARRLDLKELARADAVIYHFGIASSASAGVARFARPKALWYHTITPAHLVRGTSPRLARLLDEGRRELAAIAPRFDVLIAHSAFSAAELSELTGRAVDVIAYPLDPRRFGRGPLTRAQLTPREARWLSVGRLAPNKGLRRLLRAFAAAYAADPGARLALVGPFRQSDPYVVQLQADIQALRIGAAVTLTGAVTDGQLRAFYEAADVYVTLSEHEGFCVPLAEAMFFDIPIVAAAAAAIPETLGPAGLMVEAQATPGQVAALVARVLGDVAFRGTLLAAQRLRREAFSLDVFATALEAVIRKSGWGRTARTSRR